MRCFWGRAKDWEYSRSLLGIGERSFCGFCWNLSWLAYSGCGFGFYWETKSCLGTVKYHSLSDWIIAHLYSKIDSAREGSVS